MPEALVRANVRIADRSEWPVKSALALSFLTASVNVSVMFVPASLTVSPAPGTNVGADGPVVSVSCGVPVPNTQALLPSVFFARTRTRYWVSLVRPESVCEAVGGSVSVPRLTAVQPAETPPVCTAASSATGLAPVFGADV